MRKIASLAILVLITANVAVGQIERSNETHTPQAEGWTVQNSGVTHILLGVDFVNELIGYAVGRGSIKKTTDGGQNWIKIYSGEYRALKAISADTVYVGDEGSGMAIRTTNGGTSWDTLNTGDSMREFIRLIQAPDKALWATSSLLARSNDGLNWERLPVDIHLQSIDFATKDFGLAVGEAHTWPNQPNLGWTPTIKRTTDRGKTWATIYTDVAHQEDWEDIEFIGDSTAIAGYNSLYKTTDGGISWRTVFGPITNGIAREIDFLNDRIGVAAGGTSIFYTQDGGETWTGEEVLPDAQIVSVNIVGTGVVTVVGDGGLIMRKRLAANVPANFPLGELDVKVAVSQALVNLTYELPRAQSLSWQIFDMRGTLVNSSHVEFQEKGVHKILLDHKRLPSGTYHFEIKGELNATRGNYSITK